jgi:GNAT superfamily N-acetyltransferase
MPQYAVVTHGDRPDLHDQLPDAFREVWPEFIFHDAVASEYIARVDEHFAFFGILIVDEGQVIAGGWGVPLAWDGTIDNLPSGYDAALVQAVKGYETDVTPNTLSLMAIAVRSTRQGEGLSARVIEALAERAASRSLSRIIAPIRPTLKVSYPLATMDDFSQWTRVDGLHLDPWIRTHQRMGASILATAPASMTIGGTVAEWESWAQMAFPQSGSYIVPGALDVVVIDREQDHGIYIEPNLWMQHK